jgi:HlyD family secretion protein
MFAADKSGDFGKFIVEEARLAPFRITVTEQGNVDSMRNATLTNRVEGSTTILKIVAEGTEVSAPVKSEVDGIVSLNPEDSVSEKSIVVTDAEGVKHTYGITVGEFTSVIVEDGDEVRAGDILAGDVVCELDSSGLVDKERQQQISVTQTKASLDKADKQLEIQRSQNQSDMSAAKLAEELAELDRAKYVAPDGEFQQEYDRISGEIKQSEQDLERAREEYEFTKRMARRGYSAQNELEAQRIAVSQANITLKTKRDSLNVLEKYTKDRTISELKQLAADTKEDTKRVQLQGQAELAKFIADLDTAKLTYEVESSELTRLRRQIKACILVAPQDGEVVYASQNGGRGSQPVVIEEGASVRERQAIVKLPDLNFMKVDARIHESKISRIRTGLPVEIEVDALPGVIYNGVLESVSSVPVPGSWPNTDLKEYESVIRITDDVEKVRELRPGMNAELRIVVQQRSEDVLQVPVQGVMTMMGKSFAYVLTPDGGERRELKIGDSNDEFMEVKDGVKEGEKIIMNPRTHFADEIAELEDRLVQESEANNKKKPVKGRTDKAGAGKNWKAKGKADGGGKGGAKAGGGGGGFDPAAIFTRMDKNGDGKITADEDTSGRIMANDGDGDGGVTKEEFMEAMKKWTK